jgi:predicted outer membrane protein
MKCVSVCLVAAAAAMVWTAAMAANELKPAPPRPAFFAAAAAANVKPVSVEQREERRFLKDAAAASRFQSEAARMALGKSNDAGVRSLAATLINHDAATTATLHHMLHVRAMAPPMLDNAQRKTLNRLAKLHGRKFDREFMEEVALKHQLMDVEQYEKASLAVRDPALKAWIANTLPTLRYNLATAERSTPIEVKQASTSAPAKAAAPRPTEVKQASSSAPAKAPRPARLAAVHMAAGKRMPPRPEVATQSMGAGPAKQGIQQPGGTMQLGATKSVAARPSESNSR